MYVISEYYFRHVNDNIITSCHSDSTTRYITIHCTYIKVKIKRNKVFRDMDISLIYANIYLSSFSFQKIAWLFNRWIRDGWRTRRLRIEKKRNKETWGQNNDKIARPVRDFNCLNSISNFLPRNKNNCVIEQSAWNLLQQEL